MKFGKTLKRVLYPAWCDYYVDYKFLKGIIKKCAAALEQHINTHTHTATSTYYDSKDDTTRLYGLHRLEFFMWIAREVAKVSGFYERQLTEWEEQYQRMVGVEGGAEEQRSLDELRVLCDLLDKMRSFVLLNHLAFIKILKKYDKHVSSLTHTALSSHALAGLLGYGPSNETGSASVSCMATIMQSAFYSSPRLAVLLTNVQVQMAVRQRGGAAMGFRREQKEEESKESQDTWAHERRSGMADITSSSSVGAESGTSEDDYEFTCPICLSMLSLPVILSCSHKFCFQCLANWSTQSQKCPVCRLEHPLHPDSYTVSSTLDAFLKKTYKQQDARGKDDQEASRSAERGVEDTVMATATGEYDDDEMANKLDDPAAVIKPGRRSMHANPQKGIYSHSLHHHTVNSLKHINTLLDVATSSSYLVFDIDDTLLTNLYTPCLLTTDKGIQAYQAILARNPLYAELTLKQKNAVTRVLQRALDSKRLVESDTQLVIRSLQEMGCTCFGLTKRWSESSAETRKELLTMGIDFVGSSPFPRGRKYCDECTESLLVDGVIYTNGHEKGPVLDRFLSQIVFAQHLQAKKDSKEKDKANTAGKDAPMESKELSPLTPLAANAAIAPDFPTPPTHQPSSPSSRNAISSFASMLMSSIPNPFQREKSDSGTSNPRSPRQSPPPPSIPAAAVPLAAVPSHLIFVDDLHENAHSVFHDLTLCQHLAIPIISCHYTAVKDQMEDMLKQYETQMRRDHGPHSALHSHSADEGSSGDESGAEDKLASPVASSHSSSTSSMVVEAASAGSGSLPPLCAHSDMEILQYQVYHLVHKQQVINDQQARFIITKLKKKAQGDATAVSGKTGRKGGRKDGGREKRRSDGDEEPSRLVSNKAVAMDVRGGDMMELEVSQ